MKDWTDEECMEVFMNLLGKRVDITTAFVQGTDTIIRKQVLIVRCGESVLESAPVELSQPMRIAD